jgi:hypothetical protein
VVGWARGSDARSHEKGGGEPPPEVHNQPSDSRMRVLARIDGRHESINYLILYEPMAISKLVSCGWARMHFGYWLEDLEATEDIIRGSKGPANLHSANCPTYSCDSIVRGWQSRPITNMYHSILRTYIWDPSASALGVVIRATVNLCYQCST